MPLFFLNEGYHAEHPVILNFWKAVEYLDNEQRLRLLQVGEEEESQSPLHKSAPLLFSVRVIYLLTVCLCNFNVTPLFVIIWRALRSSASQNASDVSLTELSVSSNGLMHHSIH